jgi:signal transduction histidine kinase
MKHAMLPRIRLKSLRAKIIAWSFVPAAIVLLAVALIIKEDWATVLSSHQGYQHALLLLLALGVIASVLIVAIGVRQITHPITELINAAQQVAKGNFGQTITAQTGDEIEDLARQFNTMSRELQVFYEFMDQRVADRTSELEQAQAELELALLETDRQRQIAESLRQVAQVLTTSLDRDTVLAHIVEQLGRVIQYDGSGIFLHDGDSLAISQGGRLSSVYVGQHIPLSSPQPFVRVFKNKRPLVIPDVRDDPDWVAWEGGELIRGWMGAPLMIGDRTIGVLTVDSFKVGAYDEQAAQILQIFAHQAAIAIENARLYQQSRELAILEERNRLARELHDSVTQSLYSLRLLSEGWRRQVLAGDVEHTAEYLGRIGEITQQALKEMRLLVHELRPPALEQQGLLGALRSRLDTVEKRAGVEARIEAEDVFEWQAHIEEELYRIAQEALNNAIKHAEATCVTVRLGVHAGLAVMEIVDNGCGFDPQVASQGGGMGLGTMRERAEQLQGTLDILSQPGSGTTIKVSVPLSSDPAHTRA